MLEYQNNSCPCGNNMTFGECCEKIHLNHKEAQTAEMLMRARYSAFVKQNIDFLYNTFHPSTRVHQDKTDIKQWARENKWMQLRVIKALPNTVEFEAHYLNSDLELTIHHELSTFKKVNDLWYYVDGEFI